MIERIKEKLPLIIEWIDQTLEKNAHFSRTVTEYGFTRLPQFFSQQTLANTKVLEVEHVPIPPLASFGLPEFREFEEGHYAGIAYKDTYLLLHNLAKSESLHFHELVHILQWKYLGQERLLLAYIIGIFEQGYIRSPLELIAHELQNYFDLKKAPIDVEALVRRKLEEQFGL